MTFIKKVALEVALIVVGYIALSIMRILGQLTVRLSRVVFSR